MSGGHHGHHARRGHPGHGVLGAHRLYSPGDTRVHRLAPQVKLIATLGFGLIVVATPREAFWAFAAYGLLLALVIATAGLRPVMILRRMTVELPFVAFALLLPFVSSGPKVDFLGLHVSESGLFGAWNILAKATLGVVASIILAATTEPAALLRGLERLHLPKLMVQIMQFMLRYAEVVGSEMTRMRIARESRGYVGRDLRQLRVMASTAGALFIRSYERGERVHLAMLSRGYAGTMPTFDDRDRAAGQRDWAPAAALLGAALLICVTAWVMAR